MVFIGTIKLFEKTIELFERTIAVFAPAVLFFTGTIELFGATIAQYEEHQTPIAKPSSLKIEPLLELSPEEFTPLLQQSCDQ